MPFKVRKIDVLHVITTINRGGAENHLVDLVHGQISRGLLVGVAFLKGDAYWAGRLRALGVDVFPLNLSFYGDLRPVFRLRRIILCLNPNVVHAHMPPSEVYTRLALISVSYCPRFVISKHNDEPFFQGVGARLIGNLVARRANHIIAISDAVNAYTRRFYKLTNLSITTVRYGIDTSQYIGISCDSIAKVRQELGIVSATLVIGTIARLVPQKALHSLLEGFAKFQLVASSDAMLVIVGRGPLEEELRSLAVTLGVSDSVRWAGFREDIPAVMSSFDVFVLTSIYEGFGLVLLEAMASSKPIIATAVSAIPEIVIDGRTGLLVPPLDSTKIADALISLESGRKRKEFGNAGFERAKLDFSLNRMVEETLDVYQK